MKFEAATIKDIAKALGLSTSTISRALRDSYEISTETKMQVLEYAKKINYLPNPIALSLREKKSCSIGVVVPEIANSFFSQVIHGIESAAQQCGYNIIITQTLESYSREISTMQFLASRSVDGCLVSVSAETKNFNHFSNLYDKGFPLVFIDRVVESIDTHKVTADTMQGAYDATMHLLNNRYRRIAALATNRELSTTNQMITGYAKALQEFGLPLDERLIQYCTYGGLLCGEVEEAIDNLLYINESPDAVIAFSDNLTIGCARYCKAHHISIPDELGLTGFSNNLDLTELLSPSLSVVQQPALEMGKTAAALLIKMIEAKLPATAFENFSLPTELLIRESSTKKEKLFANKRVKLFV